MAALWVHVRGDGSGGASVLHVHVAALDVNDDVLKVGNDIMESILWISCQEAGSCLVAHKTGLGHALTDRGRTPDGGNSSLFGTI